MKKIFLSLSLLPASCASQEPASQLIQDAQSAIDDSNAQNCAAETFALAQAALRDAQKAQQNGDEETARQKARLAQSLAAQAKEEAQLNAEECEKRKNISAQIKEVFDDDLANPVAMQPDAEFQIIYFDFDESSLSSNAIAALRHNVDIMKQKPAQNVLLAAHTDERGTAEYNLALSQKRGDAVKEHASNMGIEPSRMSVVPYGKESPASTGTREQDYALNRRVEFISR